jgi:hypothetical protein
MASIEEELRLDEEENLREVEFIRQQMPADCKKVYSQSDLLWIIDALVDYYFTSGILDSNDEEVEIDMEAVANHICERAKKENVSKSFNPDDVFFIVQADLDFQEQQS